MSQEFIDWFDRETKKMIEYYQTIQMMVSRMDEESGK